MDNLSTIFLGIKVKPGPIERLKLNNFNMKCTVRFLKEETQNKINIPSTSLEFIHHGKTLKDDAIFHDIGVKSGETIHVVKKKIESLPKEPPTYTDAELQQLIGALRTFGCTPNAPGWTRAMQMLNDETAMAEIIQAVPSLGTECVTLSMLHEVEILAALGASVQTMRRGANARPDLPAALQQLNRLVGSRMQPSTATDHLPTSGFAYSLEALSEDEDLDDEETEEPSPTRITPELLAVAIQAAREMSSNRTSNAGASGGVESNLFRFLTQNASGESGTPSTPTTTPATGGARPIITSEMFSEAINQTISRFQRGTPQSRNDTPMEQSTTASTSQSPGSQYTQELQHMREMGLLDEALNMRALHICAGDVNSAINLVFSGIMGDDD